MTSKIEWAQQIKAAGLELPENWGKLSTSRAEAAKDKLLGKATKSVASIIGSGIGRMAGAILSAGAAMGQSIATVTEVVVTGNYEPEDTRRPQAKAATMPKNPNWGRSEKRLGKTQFYPVRRYAADPVPLTRQVRRQNERRSDKQPLFMSQREWHQINGFGKVAGGR